MGLTSLDSHGRAMMNGANEGAGMVGNWACCKGGGSFVRLSWWFAVFKLPRNQTLFRELGRKIPGSLRHEQVAAALGWAAHGPSGRKAPR